MLVYFVTHSVANDHLGGAEHSLLQLIEDWKRFDPELDPVLVAPTATGMLATEANRRGIRLIAVPYGGWVLFEDVGGATERAARARRDLAATRRLIAAMREDRPNLVVTNTLVAPWGAFAAAVVGIPHVWFVREFGDAAHGFRFPRGRPQMLGDVGLLSQLVVANSEALRRDLVHHIPAERVIVDYPGIDADRTRRASFEAPPGGSPYREDADLRIVVVGRVTGSKGQWRVVDAIALLRERGLRISACFVGAGVEGQGITRLRARATKRGVGDSVEFIGEQANPFPFVRLADVGVTASDREAFGRTTLECLVLGKPVVATRAGGSVELVDDGESGFLFDADSVDQLAQHLEAYARDPELLARHTERARERGDSFATRTTLDETLTRIADLVGGPAYRLPAAATEWFELPDLFAGPIVGTTFPIRTGLRRWGRRFGRLARDPVGVLRRRLGR